MLENLDKPQREWSCKVRTVAKTLEPADAERLYQLVDDEAWPALTLDRALSERGIQINYHTIARHRRKECSCSRN